MFNRKKKRRRIQEEPISKFDWRTIWLKNSGGISSKRVCGVIAWLCCLFLLITSFFTGTEIPQFAELIAITSAGLLGLDSITGIWGKSIQQNQ